MTRFLGDLLTAGLAVVEQTAPEDELRARRGVILSDTTITMTYDAGAVHVLGRGWIILDHDGRTFVLSDQQVHACGSAGCPLCPRRDRPALTRAIHRALADVGRRTTTHNWDDKAAHDRIKTLTRAFRSS